MRYLGLDLGTHCGWGVLEDEKRIDSGTWHLDQDLFQGGGWRYLLLKIQLENLLAQYQIDAVAYELVRRHGKGNNTQAAHIYGGLRATVQALLDDPAYNIPYTGVEVGTVKKYLTGKGNAGKDLMCEAANKKWGTTLVALTDASKTGDNEADALAIALACHLRLQSLT